MKLKKLAHLMALIGVVGPAIAQDTQSNQSNPSMQRVEITGSSIRRIATEGALPVQTITLDQMNKQGVTNAALGAICDAAAVAVAAVVAAVASTPTMCS